MAKSKPNAFFCFMTEKKRELEANGIIFPDGLKEVATRVDDEWRQLNPERKKHFKSKATEQRRIQKLEKDSSAVNNLSCEFSDMSLSVEVVDIRFRRYLPKDIPIYLQSKTWLEKPEWSLEMFKQIWAAPEGKNITSILIYMNHYVDRGSASIPCEMAMVAFNVEYGIMKSYWSLVDPGKIPRGYGVEALKNADFYGVNHPVTSNISNVVEDFQKFVATYPQAFLFTPRKQVKTIVKSLTWMHQTAGKEFSTTVYPFEQQLVAMSSAHLSGDLPVVNENELTTDAWMTKLAKNKARVAGTHLKVHPLVALCGTFITEKAAEEYMKIMAYIHLEELACQHHKQEKADSRMIHCALINANRMVYLGLDAVLMNYREVIPIRGQHFPEF